MPAGPRDTRLKRVVKKSLVDQVVHQLRETIVEGNLSCGDRLPSEPELVRQLGVSRPVLREAIVRLRSLGVLTVEHGRGTFVADRDAVLGCARLVRTVLHISSLELVQFMELRMALECQAARRAAERCTPEAVAELEDLYRLVHVEGIDREEAIRRDLAFHLRMVEVGGHRLMVDVMRVIQELMLEAMARTFATPQERHWAVNLHMAIVQAIRAHDPAEAEAAVRRHMDQLCERLAAGTAAADDGRVGNT